MAAGPAPSETRTVWLRPVLQVVAVTALAAAAWFVVFRISPRPAWHDFFDLRVYRGAVRWWLDGHPVYSFRLDGTRYGFTYPPFALICFLPLALVTQPVAEALHAGISAAVVVAITVWLLAPVARRHGWPRWFAAALAVPVVLALEPVRETLGYGQLNMVIFGLVVLDVVALRRGRRWAGAGIGLATALKLTPGLFVPYLLLTRRLRAAAVAAGTFAAATLVAFVVDQRDSREYWTSAVWDTERVGSLIKQSNQSLLGVLARAEGTETPGTGPWAALALAVLALGLWRAVRAARAGDELVGVTLVGLTGCLVSPITWTHHLYWVVPAVVVLVDVAAGAPVRATGARPRAAAALGALAVVVPLALSVMWFGVTRDGPTHREGVGQLADDVYTAILLGLVVLLPVRRLSGSGGPSAARTTAPPRPAGSSPR